MKNSNLIACFLIVLTPFLSSCRNQNDPRFHDEGVVIDGIRWATRNVDAPGTFAETPESFGMQFQWNRRRAWNVTDEIVAISRPSVPTGDTWQRRNDPCPRGWRVPTVYEWRSLRDTGGGIWTVQNGVPGRLYGFVPNQIFLPATGFRCSRDGIIELAGTSGGYWSSTKQNETNAVGFWASVSGSGIGWDLRKDGRSVRCVAIE